MRLKKLDIVIQRLSDYSEKIFDNKKKPSAVLDVLIATKLSQNTTDKSSFIAFKNLKAKFGKWDYVASGNLNDIKNCIRVCGLVNTKASEIKEMLKKMKKKYGSLDLNFLNKLTNDEIYEELCQYKGIGIKTISCVLIFALRRDAFPVDTHVHRILNRIGIVKSNTAEETFKKIANKIPEGKKYELHSNLIKFGRNVCKAKNPLCSECILYDVCMFPDKKLYRTKKFTNVKKKNNFIILENI